MQRRRLDETRQIGSEADEPGPYIESLHGFCGGLA